MSRTDDILNDDSLSADEKVEQLRQVPTTVPRTNGEAVQEAERQMIAAPPGNNRDRHRAAHQAISTKLAVMDERQAASDLAAQGEPVREADDAPQQSGPGIEMVSRDEINRQETTDE